MSETPSLSPDIVKFLTTKHAVVVDPSAAFVHNISLSLEQIGLTKKNIHSVYKFEEAQSIIELRKPSIIVSEYFLGKHFGIDLIQQIDSIHGESQRIAIIVTHNSSDSAIAEAAEGHIDSYILKPFSMTEFGKKLTDAIRMKVTPSKYILHIRAGRENLDKNEFEKAVEEFNSAKQQNEKPSLAFYYTGLAALMKENHGAAVGEFKAGLKLTPLHYKCLIGEFDTLFHSKRYQDVYKLIPDIIKNFPISPNRLLNFIITSVWVNHFDDLDHYLLMYKDLEHRPADLVKIFSLSMRTAARFYFKQNDHKRCFTCYENSITIAGFNSQNLDVTVREMLKYKNAQFNKAASDLYRKYPTDLVGSEAHAILGFYIECSMERADVALEYGKKIMAKYNCDRDFYRKMVEMAKEGGKKVFGEDIIQRAIQNFPDIRKELFDLLEK